MYADDDAGSSTGWKKSADKLTGSVTNGSSYFICAFGGPKNWGGAYASSGTLYFEGTFATVPPDNLTQVDGWSTATRTISMYVEIE